MITDQQALSTIERLCGDDFCEVLDMRSNELTGDLKTAHEKLSAIYRIAHSLVASHICFENHDDWRKEAEETAKALETV